MARLAALLALLIAAVAVPEACHAQGGTFTQRLPILNGSDAYKVTLDVRQNFTGGFFLRGTPSALTALTPNQAVITIFKCGVLAPHFHPRGTEQLLVTNGQAEVGILLEDSVLRKVTLTVGQVVILPAGSVHYTRNTGNDTLRLIQTFDNPQPGTIFLGSTLLALDQDIVYSNLPGANFNGVTAASNIFLLSWPQNNQLCKP